MAGEIKIVGTIVPFDMVEPDMPSHLASYGKGGHRTVDGITNRDLIPDVLKEDGMTVYVVEEKKTYQLQDNQWVVFGAGGSGGGNSSITYGEYDNKPALLDNGEPLLIFNGISGLIISKGVSGLLTAQIDPEFVLDEGEIE